MLVLACAGGQPSLSSFDADGLMERGMAAYREHHWTEAIRYLDRMVLEYPNSPRAEEARYYLADTYFGKKEYVSAAGRFTRLAEDYPRGEYADDARFKACESYHRLAPDPELDQEYTSAAIDHCDQLVLYFPDSEFAPRAQEIADAMRNRLARKVLLSGEYYVKRHAFDSAIIYFQLVLSDYARTDVAPQALLRLAETYDRIGYDEEAQQARDRLLKDYPESSQAKSLASRSSSAAGGADAGTGR